MEIWVEFNGGKWRVSPDPAVVPRGTPLSWRFRADDVNTPHLRWTIYFNHGHPFTFESNLSAMRADQLEIVTETFRLSDGQHVGTSPIIEADSDSDAPRDYKYGVRLEDIEENRELGDEDPTLIVLGLK